MASERKIQGAVKDAQDRAKTAFEKSQAAVADANEFSKGNLEALVESGKILANGLQAMGKVYAEEVKSTFETLQADAKDLTSVKSPKEFVRSYGPGSRRGELNRKWDPIQPAADFGHSTQLAVIKI